MWQVVRRLHNGMTALVGIMCGELCDEVGFLVTFFDAVFISAGGCFGRMSMYEQTYATFVRVVPGYTDLGRLYLRIVQKFQ